MIMSCWELYKLHKVQKVPSCKSFRKAQAIPKSHYETVHHSRTLNHSVSTEYKKWNIILTLLASFPHCLLSIGASCRVVREMYVSISWWARGGQCGRSTRGSRREPRWLSGRKTTPSFERSMTPGGQSRKRYVKQIQLARPRYQKMVEWMDNVEMAIQKVCASKVYTSAEFKREKDNFHVGTTWV